MEEQLDSRNLKFLGLKPCGLESRYPHHNKRREVTSMSYKDYDDKKLKKAIKESKSIAGVLRILGKKPVGGNYQTIKNFIQNNDIDTSHWTGQGWNKGIRFKKVGNYARPHKIKKVLSEIRGWFCEKCKREKWQGKPIPLEIHHKDLDRTNNDESNLILLCRNCHFVVHGKM